MTTIGNTIIGRTIVKNAATMAIRIPTDAPPGAYKVRLWVSEWFSREPQHLPVYFEYTKKRCSPEGAPILPMDSTVFELNAIPGTEIWVCGESDAILNYAVDKVA